MSLKSPPLSEVYKCYTFEVGVKRTLQKNTALGLILSGSPLLY